MAARRSRVTEADRSFERAPSSVRSRVEHPFRAAKGLFGIRGTGYRGLAKTRRPMQAAFALANLQLARRPPGAAWPRRPRCWPQAPRGPAVRAADARGRDIAGRERPGPPAGRGPMVGNGLNQRIPKNKPAHIKDTLDVDRQIEHLKSKGIKFELCGEDAAREYLSSKCNLFKVSSYRKLFSKYVGGENDGKYVDLDFGQLKPLASIDNSLRGVLRTLALDIEHFQKVALLNKMEQQEEEEDGYSIVADYLNSLSPRDRAYKDNELERCGYSPCSKAICRKYKDNLPVWVFLEMISFGTLVDFTKFCGKRWEDKALTDSHYDLKRVKSVRNCTSHGSCIINSFADGPTRIQNVSSEVLSAVAEAGAPKNTRQKWMKNAPVREIAITIVRYSLTVPEGKSKERAKAALTAFFDEVDATRGKLPRTGARLHRDCGAEFPQGLDEEPQPATLASDCKI